MKRRIRKGKWRINNIWNINDFNTTINEFDLTDIYRPLHPVIAGNISALSGHGTVIKRENILGHNVNFNRFYNIKNNTNYVLFPQQN